MTEADHQGLDSLLSSACGLYQTHPLEHKQNTAKQSLAHHTEVYLRY